MMIPNKKHYKDNGTDNRFITDLQITYGYYLQIRVDLLSVLKPF